LEEAFKMAEPMAADTLIIEKTHA